ncbi:MAG: hypothetical protein LBH01_11345 [Verrucomicrobiales bacterium]|jgi:hypothetical protein|nr:hypothetical protein [Verrucomicrobiales bacterium]
MNKPRVIAGQSSWIIKNAVVEAAVTQQAGHLGPVRFRVGGRWIEPFDLAPWAGEKLPAGTPQILRVLRGDFFCMPFGGNETPYHQEQYPPHGETANKKWRLASGNDHALQLVMNTAIRKGRVRKTIGLVPGQTALYCQHVISGMSGPMSFGHHAILKLPKPEAGRVSVSRFHFGQVLPQVFEQSVQGGYSILKPGAKFNSLRRVPRSDGKFADLSVYPAREGYEDLTLLATDPELPFGWTAVTVPDEGYVWFALKDPRVLPSTVFWMSNGGRHYAPWSSRHRHAIGLEEVCSYFHLGLAESARRNHLNRAGIPTCAQLDPRQPLTVNYIMAVAAIPRGFDCVKDIRPDATGKGLKLIAQSGKSANAKMELSFLSSGPLA